MDDTSTATCGSACSPCAAPASHGAAACVAGACGFACDAGYVPSGGDCVQAVRQVAPLSASRVTSRRPVLRWVTAPGVASVRVEICADRACASVIDTVDNAPGVAVPNADLPARRWAFWRLTASLPGGRTAVSPTWQFWVPAGNAPVKTSWGAMLDVNGDGYVDAATGQSSANGSSITVLRSGPAGFTDPAIVLADPTPSANECFGVSIASAGDVDGDGYDDFVVGAKPSSRSVSPAGHAYLYAGGPAGLASTPSAVIANGDATVSGFGTRVSAAGDVDGDGYGDVLVAANGRVLVYRGSASGLSTVPATVLTAPPGSGASFGGSFGPDSGSSIASAGDVNGDGLGDIVLGSSLSTDGEGVVFVYFGSPAGIRATPDVTIPWSTADLGSSGNSFGAVVACAGDTDGDGYADILASAPQANSGLGLVNLYRGGSAATLTTRVATFTDRSDPVTNRFGSTLSGAVDVDGNGLDDFIIGNPGFCGSTGFPGAAFVVPSMGAAGFPTMVRLDAPGSTCRYGWSVAGMGDLNRDGFEDVLVGALAGSSTEPRSLFAYCGSASGIGTAPCATFMGPYGGVVASRAAHPRRARARRA